MCSTDLCKVESLSSSFADFSLSTDNATNRAVDRAESQEERKTKTVSFNLSSNTHITINRVESREEHKIRDVSSLLEAYLLTNQADTRASKTIVRHIVDYMKFPSLSIDRSLLNEDCKGSIDLSNKNCHISRLSLEERAYKHLESSTPPRHYFVAIVFDNAGNMTICDAKKLKRCLTGKKRHNPFARTNLKKVIYLVMTSSFKSQFSYFSQGTRDNNFLGQSTSDEISANSLHRSDNVRQARKKIALRDSKISDDRFFHLQALLLHDNPQDSLLPERMQVLSKSFRAQLRVREVLQKASELFSHNALIQYQIGNQQYWIGEDLQAEKCYLKAIALGRKTIYSLIVLGDIYRRRQNYKKAKEYLEEAFETTYISDRSLNCFAHGILGDVLRQQGDYNSAETHLRLAISLNDKDFFAYGILEDVLRQRGAIRHDYVRYQA